MSLTTRAFIRDQLANVDTQWNLGTFGAIAEFMRDPGEPVSIHDEAGHLSATTDRGGIGFSDLSEVTLFASESAVGSSWSHRVALCLPEASCAMNRREALTELGPDVDALREEDRGAILFDMGLATLQVDICVRASNADLIAALRAVARRSLFEPANPAMGAILTHGPHRVFMTRFGRAEVFQPIPPPDGTSPIGPHTHVLPKLLRSGRTHAATEFVPEGLVPCAHLVPAHPIKDAMGRPRSWDGGAHEQFQRMLEAYGDARLHTCKAEVVSAVRDGREPGSFVGPATRAESHAMKAALRQIATSPDRPSGLSGWLDAFDARNQDARDEPEEGDVYGHA